ncbi:MAG: hydrogenase formation protein HypD [Deltaproteobacteria bacterium]|nr:hydrogenase formation protein HypD [Deltaproteobacteria bacterium]
MELIDEYRDPGLIKALLTQVTNSANALGKSITIMEVCGSHTNAIGRYGLRSLLPPSIRLVSGPGCPVCVTSVRDIDIALYLAAQPSVILATFGDMLRVPGSGGNCLQKLRADGADIRIISSALDCLSLAADHPDHKIVFLGIGFETTSPTVAAMIDMCDRKKLKNISLFSVHKLVPPAIQVLLDDPELNIDAFLCPGHVSTILGTAAYNNIIQKNRAAVITGFEPADILQGIHMILQQIAGSSPKIEIQYQRAVKPEGNHKALDLLDRIFTADDAEWRGLGTIPASGLVLNKTFKTYDALQRFNVPDISAQDIPGCSCGSILKGILSPLECPLFKKACTPANPIGPCMVSAEGTCAAYYKYH